MHEQEQGLSKENKWGLGTKPSSFFITLFLPRSAGTIAPSLLTECLEQAMKGA